ncbi:MAG TPA: AI-2E family transporter [Bryobacteraceae bacterium]|nr:AI-2E family transporter [Bryobacteraceae bacterium]
MPRLTAVARPLPAGPAAEERAPFWWLRWVPAAVLTFALLYLAYIVGRVAIVPVLSSFAIAYVMNPIVVGFEKRGITRWLAAIAAMMVVGICIALFLWFVVPDLWQEAAKAGEAIMANLNPAKARQARAELREFSPLLDRMVGYRLEQFLRSPESLTQASQSWAAGSLTGFLATAAGALDLLIIPFFVYYILVDFQRWRVSFDELIPPRFGDAFSRLFDEVGRILQSYVLGQLLIAIIMAGLYAGGFALLRVPAWAGLAALSGFLNVVPYVGTGLGVVLASGFTFAAGGDLWRVAGVIGVFIVVQMVEGYILTPRILGGRLSLHPMAVFLGLLIGGRLFGFLGVLLAVPVSAVAQVFFKFLREIYRASEFYRAGEIGPEPAPALVEEVIAKAADTVLAEQGEKQKGNEVLLTPPAAEDDPAALRAR